jgi:hypothetical protein
MLYILERVIYLKKKYSILVIITVIVSALFLFEYYFLKGKNEANEKPVITSGFVRLTDEEIIDVIKSVYNNMTMDLSKESVIAAFGTKFTSNNSNNRLAGNIWTYEYFKNYALDTKDSNKSDIDLLKKRNMGIKLSIVFNDLNHIYSAEMLYVMGPNNTIYKVSFNPDGTITEAIID